MESLSTSKHGREAAWQQALASRSELVLSAEDAEVLWWLLHRRGPTADGGACDEGEGEVGEVGGATSGWLDSRQAAAGGPWLDYDEFTQVAGECREAIGPQTDAYFQASTFLRLAHNQSGRVSAPALFRYCCARSALIRLRVELGVLDGSGSGALAPHQLLTWLQRRAPLAACSQHLVSESDWCSAVLARLMLLHGRRGRLLIRDLLSSPAVHELVVLLLALEAAEAGAAAANKGASPGMLAIVAQQQVLLQGWFAPAAVAALRLRFDELDGDGDGLLSQQEFAGFSQTMTALAVQRVFAQLASGCTTTANTAPSSSSRARTGLRQQPAMDFPAFCTFCAAWQQRHHPAAAAYVFRLLDLGGCGYLSQADLYTFFREVHALWLALGQSTDLRVEDVMAEVNDLLRAPDPHRITAADFQRCGAAGTVLGLLLDVGLLWEYENREALLQQQQQQQQAQQL